MKRLVPIIFATLFLLGVVTGCNKKPMSDEPGLQTYYVRYTATTMPGDTIDLSYRLPDGKSQAVEQKCPDGTFTATIGPVIKGFEALMIVSQTIGQEPGALSIETRTESSPFDMKAHSDHAIMLTYTVGD